MAGKNIKKRETGRVVMTYTVAECGEFHSMGRYHEGIKTLEEAAAIYRKMQTGNSVPAIGINLHVEGTKKMADSQLDVVTGRELIWAWSGLCRNFVTVRLCRKR